MSYLFDAILSENENEFFRVSKKSSEKDFFYRDRAKRSLLINAIIEELTNVAFFLIDKGIYLDEPDNKGLTPLHYCSLYNNSRIAEALISKGIEVDCTDNFGNTPLWGAVFEAKQKDYDIVEFLVKSGSNPNIKNESDISPYDFAIRIGDNKLLDILNKSEFILEG